MNNENISSDFHSFIFFSFFQKIVHAIGIFCGPFFYHQRNNTETSCGRYYSVLIERKVREKKPTKQKRCFVVTRLLLPMAKACEYCIHMKSIKRLCYDDWMSAWIIAHISIGKRCCATRLFLSPATYLMNDDFESRLPMSHLFTKYHFYFNRLLLALSVCHSLTHSRSPLFRSTFHS